ncbi:MAG: TolC family protein [Bacteroidota bacterium]
MRYLILLGLLVWSAMYGQPVKGQTVFSSFADFMDYATEKSIDLQKGEIGITRAKKLKLASILGILDPTGNIGLSYKNNTELPVTLVPGEAVGGEAGTIEEVQFGLQYETQFATELNVKLLNLAGWSERRLTKINLDLTKTNQKITLKQFYDNTASIYYGVLTLQAQQQSTKTNLTIADTIRQSVALRFNQGLASQQEVNEAQVNYLQLEESDAQISFLIDQQYNTLKTLCDISDDEEIRIVESPQSAVIFGESSISPNNLMLQQARLNEQYTRSSLRKSKFGFAPTVSVIAFNSQQQFNTEAQLFDSDVNWIPSSYVGFRLNIPIPGYRQGSAYFKAKYDHLLAEKNRRQAEIQIASQTEELGIDYAKAITQEQFDESIYQLKKDTYEKDFLSYQQGVTDLNHALTSFQEMISVEYDWIASKLNVALHQTKININNTIQ